MHYDTDESNDYCIVVKDASWSWCHFYSTTYSHKYQFSATVCVIKSKTRYTETYVCTVCFHVIIISKNNSAIEGTTISKAAAGLSSPTNPSPGANTMKLQLWQQRNEDEEHELKSMFAILPKYVDLNSDAFVYCRVKHPRSVRYYSSFQPFYWRTLLSNKNEHTIIVASTVNQNGRSRRRSEVIYSSEVDAVVVINCLDQSLASNDPSSLSIHFWKFQKEFAFYPY